MLVKARTPRPARLHSVWSAWIEIFQPLFGCPRVTLHSVWSAWIEIFPSCTVNSATCGCTPSGVHGLKYLRPGQCNHDFWLHSVWSAWIEISFSRGAAKWPVSCTPSGVHGLKLIHPHQLRPGNQLHSVWSAWIEIPRLSPGPRTASVALRLECMD